MGHIRHHAIVVTSCSKDLLDAAHHVAQSLFGDVSTVVPSARNGYLSFFVPPDGSKERWDVSREGDEKRQRFIDWIATVRSLNLTWLQGNLHWAEVAYGDSEWERSVVERSSPHYEQEVNKQLDRFPFPELTLAIWRHFNGDSYGGTVKLPLDTFFDNLINSDEMWMYIDIEDADAFKRSLEVECNEGFSGDEILAQFGLYTIRGLLVESLAFDEIWRIIDDMMDVCNYECPLQFNAVHVVLELLAQMPMYERPVRTTMIELLQNLKYYADSRPPAKGEHDD